MRWTQLPRPTAPRRAGEMPSENRMPPFETHLLFAADSEAAIRYEGWRTNCPRPAQQVVACWPSGVLKSEPTQSSVALCGTISRRGFKAGRFYLQSTLGPGAIGAIGAIGARCGPLVRLVFAAYTFPPGHETGHSSAPQLQPHVRFTPDDPDATPGRQAVRCRPRSLRGNDLSPVGPERAQAACAVARLLAQLR